MSRRRSRRKNLAGVAIPKERWNGAPGRTRTCGPRLKGEFLCRERLEFQQIARTATRACHAIDVVELTDVHCIVGFRRPQVAVRGARVKRAVR